DGEFSLADGTATTIALTAPELAFEANAVFEVDALEDGTGDLLTNIGTIELNGGQVRAISNDGAWSVAQDYTILRADGGLTGTFDSATSNQPYLDASLAYTANSVILSLERIDGLIQGDILETTNAQQLSVAARVIPQIIQGQVSNSIRNLLGSSGGTSSVAYSPVSFATGLSAGDATSSDAKASGSGWLNITPTRYDQRALLPGTTGLQEIDGESVSLLAGLDRVLGSRFVAGAFVGYEDSEVEYRAISGLQENTGFILGGYGGVAFNQWLFSSVNLSWAQLDNELEERAFNAAEAQRANYDSQRLSFGVDLTAATQRGKLSYLAKAAFNYSEESYDAYRTGRGERVQLEDLSLARLSFGGEVSYLGESWNPYLAVNYEVDTSASQTVADDNGFVVNAGIRTVHNERLALEAYLATVTGRSNENQELLGFNINYAF
ncbi:MAG: autotransporter outer membrane beta-barrel domain-containing protein, partial [Pseudomonadota bacterium]